MWDILIVTLPFLPILGEADSREANQLKITDQVSIIGFADET